MKKYTIAFLLLLILPTKLCAADKIISWETLKQNPYNRQPNSELFETWTKNQRKKNDRDSANWYIDRFALAANAVSLGAMSKSSINECFYPLLFLITCDSLIYLWRSDQNKKVIISVNLSYSELTQDYIERILDPKNKNELNQNNLTEEEKEWYERKKTEIQTNILQLKNQQQRLHKDTGLYLFGIFGTSTLCTLAHLFARKNNAN